MTDMAFIQNNIKQHKLYQNYDHASDVQDSGLTDEDISNTMRQALFLVARRLGMSLFHMAVSSLIFIDDLSHQTLFRWAMLLPIRNLCNFFQSSTFRLAKGEPDDAEEYCQKAAKYNIVPPPKYLHCYPVDKLPENAPRPSFCWLPLMQRSRDFREETIKQH
jgi:hypothetical protein